MRIAVFAVCCCIAGIAIAAEKKSPAFDAVGKVTAVEANGTITLSTIGTAALAGVVFPNPAGATEWLSEYALQHSVDYRAGEMDRFGRTQIISQLQHDMLNDGAAVYYASEGSIPEDWKQTETLAHTAKRGVWDDRAETVFTSAAQTNASIGKFRVVEGTIVRVYSAKSATYLNFGEDWHTDFSVMIPAKNRRSFSSLLPALKPGSHIIVRGFIFEENGPMITLTHPDNIEIR